MILYIITASGKHKKQIYFTNDRNKYWSDNIEDAKLYSKGRACSRLRTMKFNNPSVLPVYVDYHKKIRSEDI